jgi:hypothetical protein
MQKLEMLPVAVHVLRGGGGGDHDVGYLSPVVSENVCHAQIRKRTLIETTFDSECRQVCITNTQRLGTRFFFHLQLSKRIMGPTILD